MPHTNPGVNVEDDGVNQGRFDRINFATGLTATPAAGKVDIDASGGGGGTNMETKDQGVSLTATTTSIDFQGGGIRASVISGNDIKVIVEGSQKGLLGARPAAAADNAGMAYFATDVPALYISDGSTWTTVFTGTLLTTANIGSTVQAWDADLDTIASLTATTDNFIVGVSSAWASRTPTQVRTTLGLVIGTNVQAWDADLDAIAALTPSNDDFMQRKAGAWTNRTIAQVRTDLGALLAANNLSDVAATGTSRYNLHDQILAAAQAVSTANVASKSGTPTVDGYATSSGDVVLLTAQSSASENGPWTVAAGAWSRPSDYPAGGAVRSRVIQVNNGTVYKNTIWNLETNGAITIDTTATVWMPPGQVRYVILRVIDSAQNAAAGTTYGGDFECPLTGTIVEIGGWVDTAGTTGTMVVDVNKGGTTLMTTDKIKWDTGEKSSRDFSGNVPGLTTTSIAAGNIITVDVDTAHTTPAKGLTIRLGIKVSL